MSYRGHDVYLWGKCLLHVNIAILPSLNNYMENLITPSGTGDNPCTSQAIHLRVYTLSCGSHILAARKIN